MLCKLSSQPIGKDLAALPQQTDQKWIEHNWEKFLMKSEDTHKDEKLLEAVIQLYNSASNSERTFDAIIRRNAEKLEQF